jgi:hypothetical protein
MSRWNWMSPVGLASPTGSARSFPGAVDVVLARRDETAEARAAARIGRNPSDLFAEYLAERNIDDAALVALFGELLEEAHET